MQAINFGLDDSGQIGQVMAFIIMPVFDDAQSAWS
jgi:hypothetical protein